MGYNVNNTRDGIKGVQKLAGKPLKEKTVQKTKIYGFLQNYMYMYDTCTCMYMLFSIRNALHQET